MIPVRIKLKVASSVYIYFIFSDFIEHIPESHIPINNLFSTVIKMILDALKLNMVSLYLFLYALKQKVPACYYPNKNLLTNSDNISNNLCFLV